MRPVTWLYKFVEEGYQSERRFFVETNPRTIAYCAERLAADAHDTGDHEDRLRSPDRPVLVFEQLPQPQGAA